MLRIARACSRSCTKSAAAAAVVAVLAATSAVGLVTSPAGAGSSGGDSSKVGSGKDQVQITQFHVTLTSQSTNLHQVGKDGEHTYGWNLLTGTGSSDSGDIAVEMQGAVNYVKGKGRFTGFVTLTFASQGQVGFTMRGESNPTSDGGSEFTSKMSVIEGTGPMIGVKGAGAWTGSRDAEVGAPVEADFVIRLRGIDIG